MSIEFLDAEPAGEPENEELPPERNGHWLKRLWLPLAAVALLVVALVTVDVVPGRSPKPKPTDTPQLISGGKLVFLNPNDHPDQFAPYPDVSLAREIPILRGIPDLPTTLLPGGRLPCPARTACYFNRTMPPAVLAALRATFPVMEPPRILTLETQRSGRSPYVYFRQIYLVNDTLDVTIRVVTPESTGLGFAGTVGYGTRTVNYTVVPNGGYAVIIHVEAPTGADPYPSRLRELAADSRLYTPLP